MSESFEVPTVERNDQRQEDIELKKAKETYEGYSEKEQTAVDIMRLLVEIEQDLEKRDVSPDAFKRTLHDKLELISGNLQDILNNEEKPSSVYRKNNGIHRIAWILDKSDRSEK